MIKYIGKSKPETDEYALNLRLIENQMIKKTKIGIYAFPGSGKSQIMRALKRKYRDTKWNFYDLHESDVVEPYVYTFISDVQGDVYYLPEFEVIYVLQYSTAYKEAISGIRFTDFKERPLGEYMKYAQWYQFGSKELLGTKVKNISQLRNLLKGE